MDYFRGSNLPKNSRISYQKLSKQVLSNETSKDVQLFRKTKRFKKSFSKQAQAIKLPTLKFFDRANQIAKNGVSILEDESLSNNLRFAYEAISDSDETLNHFIFGNVSRLEKKVKSVRKKLEFS